MTTLPATKRPISSPQTGFTLVELLVAMVIGLLVMAGATQLFITSQHSYRLQTALADMQDIGRFSLDTLSRELRQADYIGGCAPTQTTVHLRNIANTGHPPLSLQAWDDANGSDFATNLINPVPGQHSVAFRGALVARTGFANDSLAVTSVDNPQQLSLNRNIDSLFSGQLVLLQGLQSCDIFYNTSNTASLLQKAASAGWLGNVAASASPWGNVSGFTYIADQSISLSALSGAIYYIGLNPDSGSTPSLMRLDISQTTPHNEVLASNVVAMRTSFLVDDQYLPPEQLSATEWATVRALRISLIVQSDQADLRNADTTLTMGNFRGDNVFTANDGRLYQAFTTTVTLRNR
ncbi:PilW family protein [Vreelandella olivaria]|uniref:PilW family protein n=1 Tax=Vreelandella olivaria TaxID=390919 RepID=UPI00201F2104|nr:PilW family protein [Halomonas olivaria]